MDLIRQLRTSASMTQQQLAAHAATSQSTIAAYESGTKSLTLRTVERFAASLGLELIAAFTPRMTREDHRSLAFHHAIAEIIRNDPVPALCRAKENLNRLRKLHPGAASLFARWHAWMDMPAEELIARMLDHGLISRDMRQVSPFSGLLSAPERAQLLRRFRKDH